MAERKDRMVQVVTGGSGSGKSAYAEEQICALKKETGARHLYYIATMFPYGEETEKKIERHRQMRKGKGFETIECFTDLEGLAERDAHFSGEAEADGICVLLECMSNLTANELYLENGARERTADCTINGIRHLKEQCRGLIIVTNEVFSETPVKSPEMQEYVRVLGEINCRMAEEAERVTEVVYGIPVEAKG